MVRGVALAKGPNTRTRRSGWPGSGGLENLELNDFHEFQLNCSDNEKGNEAELLMNIQEAERVSSEGTSQRCVLVPGESYSFKMKLPFSKTPAF